jgi:hypothetical protein
MGNRKCVQKIRLGLINILSFYIYIPTLWSARRSKSACTNIQFRITFPSIFALTLSGVRPHVSLAGLCNGDQERVHRGTFCKPVLAGGRCKRARNALAIILHKPRTFPNGAVHDPAINFCKNCHLSSANFCYIHNLHKNATCYTCWLFNNAYLFLLALSYDQHIMNLLGES